MNGSRNHPQISENERRAAAEQIEVQCVRLKVIARGSGHDSVGNGQHANDRRAAIAPPTPESNGRLAATQDMAAKRPTRSLP